MPTTVAPADTAENAVDTGTSAPTLSEMQAAFQNAIMLGDDSVLSEILDSSRTTRHILFGVYRHAYLARLIEVVRNDYLLLHAYLGDEAFDDIARSYILAHPSRNQNVRWFSRHLPDHLAETRSKEPHLTELASLERASNDAFDAPDRVPLALADLASVPPEDWADLVFVPHPSARCLSFSTNAHALWLALKNAEAPPSVETLPAPKAILVWRQDTTPKIRHMAGEEAMMWHEAVNGVSFGGLCELVAVYDDPDTAPLRAAQHLQAWILSGLLENSLTAE